MNSRLWKEPWRLMLVVNVAVFFGVLLHKIALPPYVPYVHLLVDYHFGFTKRALIGAIVSLFTDKVPVWLVFALGRSSSRISCTRSAISTSTAVRSRFACC